MLNIRRAAAGDLELLTKVNLDCTGSPMDDVWPKNRTPEEIAERREEITAALESPDAYFWICEDTETGESVGVASCFIYTADPGYVPRAFFGQRDPEYFTEDGRFCEINDLWVHPDYRRRGIATRLKQEIEATARQRGMRMIYTITEEARQGALELSLELGYEVLRRGPVWDDGVERVQLIKKLEPEQQDRV